jgi:hypothetical protein
VLDDRSKSLIRALLYPVQFEKEPEAGVRRVFERVVAARALGASPDEYLHAIRLALESGDKLSQLLPQAQREQTVRKYLATMQETIAHAPGPV